MALTSYLDYISRSKAQTFFTLHSVTKKMERVSSLVIIIAMCFLIFEFMVMCCNAIETPQYTVVRSESDFEIRLHGESYWMSALVPGISFEKSTKEGFHRLYQYIHGANLNSTQLVMTAPILTSITQSSDGFEYFVRFYLPAKYEGSPPQPSPELNLQFYKWRSHCIAVRKFSGFAKDDTVNEEKEALMSSLDNQLIGKAADLEDKDSYTIAQYNASRHLSGRLNEVWMNVLGFSAEGCPSYQGRY